MKWKRNEALPSLIMFMNNWILINWKKSFIYYLLPINYKVKYKQMQVFSSVWFGIIRGKLIEHERLFEILKKLFIVCIKY